MARTPHGWIPKLKKSGPAYLMIADAIATDIAYGRLKPGQQLPPQRKLAHHLGLDFTTVARAYTEAHQRGLIEAIVGRGTFVSGQRRLHVPHLIAGDPLIDLSVNAPPQTDDPALLASMQKDVASVGTQIRDLVRYQSPGGITEDRDAGALWLRRRGLTVDSQRLLLTAGAQHALLIVLLTIAQRGSVVCCEELTYPGLRLLAGQLGLRLIGLPMDLEGIDAVAFAVACKQYAPVALYCNPTLLNPTTATISAKRRLALIDVARHHGVAIIEDDAYGFLHKHAPPALAVHGADITFYIASLSKSVGAGLRIAYLVAPDTQLVHNLKAAIQASTIMVSPITASLATCWVRNGTADRLLSAVRTETKARQKIAARILPCGSFGSAPGAFHLWLRLPEHWDVSAFALHMKSVGVDVVASTNFYVGATAPAAVRVSLGGVMSRNELEVALVLIKNVLADSSSHFDKASQS